MIVRFRAPDACLLLVAQRWDRRGGGGGDFGLIGGRALMYFCLWQTVKCG